jgi:membrane protein required for colicin V production
MQISLQNFIWVDYAIVGVILLSALISLARGFVSEAISLATWIAALFVAYKFSKPLSVNFTDYIHSPSVRYGVIFFALFVIVLIVGAIVNFVVRKLVTNTGLSGTDRILGLVFGFARGILLVAVLILLGGVLNISKATWWEQSQLVPQFQGLVVWLKTMLPEQFTELNSQLSSTLKNNTLDIQQNLNAARDSIVDSDDALIVDSNNSDKQ